MAFYVRLHSERRVSCEGGVFIVFASIDPRRPCDATCGSQLTGGRVGERMHIGCAVIRAAAELDGSSWDVLAVEHLAIDFNARRGGYVNRAEWGVVVVAA